MFRARPHEALLCLGLVLGLCSAAAPSSHRRLFFCVLASTVFIFFKFFFASSGAPNPIPAAAIRGPAQPPCYDANTRLETIEKNKSVQSSMGSADGPTADATCKHGLAPGGAAAVLGMWN